MKKIVTTDEDRKEFARIAKIKSQTARSNAYQNLINKGAGKGVAENIKCQDAKKAAEDKCKEEKKEKAARACIAAAGKMSTAAGLDAIQSPKNQAAAGKTGNATSEGKGGEAGKGGGAGGMAGMAAMAGMAGMAAMMQAEKKKMMEEAKKKEAEIMQKIEDEKAAAQAQQELMKQEFEDRMQQMRDSLANQSSGLGCPVDFTNCQSAKTQACGPAGVAVCCSATDPGNGSPLYPDQYNTDFCDSARTNAARQQSQAASGMMGGFGVPANGIAAGGMPPQMGGQMPSLPNGQIPNLPNGQMPNGQMPDLGNIQGDVGSLGGGMPNGGGSMGDLGRVPSNLPRPQFNIANTAKAKPAVRLGPVSQNNFSTVSKRMCREYRSGQLIGTQGYGCAK